MPGQLTCKHVAANAEQRANMILNVQIGKKLGATPHMIAGAIATMIQESDAMNLKGQDQYGSAGLYGQRAIYYGGYANTINPSLAITKFYQSYLPYCRRGMEVIAASNETQRSAYPTAPAQWLSESERNVGIILGGKDISDATSTASIGLGGGSTKTITRNQPYEFSRGSPGQPETSWDCMGRLASEVAWDRFMRGGSLWFVSEDWLRKQPPRFAFSTGARGVIEIDFNADSRRNASEATVTALAKRWSVLPGDVVRVAGQGPGDGLWLVSETSRSMWDDTTQITLKRPAPAKPEPAPQTTTKTITVGGKATITPGGGSASPASSAPRSVNALFAAAKEMTDFHIPYSTSARTLVAHPPSADCSSSVCWALLKAGFPLPGGVSWGTWAPCSWNFAGWGVPGYGKHFTVNWTNEHVWIRFYAMPAKRFDTVPGGGPQLRYDSYAPDYRYNHVHWPGL
jgi:hypothetical protein